IKHVLFAEARRWALEQRHVLDVDFIDQHTTGFEALKAHIQQVPWDRIEQESGLSRSDLEAAAEIYIQAPKTIAVYGMGLTQQVHGFENLASIVNLLLLKGNIGREGTGCSPVRGHSNVQGQRTVGIAEKPELVPLDKLSELFGFEPPGDKGVNTVEACEKILSGQVKAFSGLGGNFLRAVPERERMEAAWPAMRLTVQVATRLNR